MTQQNFPRPKQAGIWILDRFGLVEQTETSRLVLVKRKEKKTKHLCLPAKASFMSRVYQRGIRENVPHLGNMEALKSVKHMIKLQFGHVCGFIRGTLQSCEAQIQHFKGCLLKCSLT